MSSMASSVQERDKGKQVSVEALTNLCHKVTIEDEEDFGLVYEEDESASRIRTQSWCLVGKFLTDRIINSQAMKSTLSALWRPMKGVFIRDIKPNLFYFSFFVS